MMRVIGHPISSWVEKPVNRSVHAESEEMIPEVENVTANIVPAGSGVELIFSPDKNDARLRKSRAHFVIVTFPSTLNKKGRARPSAETDRPREETARKH